MNRISNLPLLLAFWVTSMVPCASLAQSCQDELACNYNPAGGDYCMETQVYAVHTEGTLAGMTTYRLYLNLNGPMDQVSAVFGDGDFPTHITTTTSFYQDPLGAATPNGINPILFDFAPALEFDSWATIGIQQVPNAALGEGVVSIVQDEAQPWSTNFESGGDIVITTIVGGAWYVTNDLSNGLGDENGQVLIGQFTTDGVLGGMVSAQIFPNGELGGQGDLVSFNVGQTCACIYPTTYYVDNDGDGYGTTPVELCELTEGFATQSGDCNDFSQLAFPGNPNELVGDGIDGDCNGGEVCFRDVDNDGYRSADNTDVIGSPENINCSEFGEAYGYQPIDCDDENPALTIPDEDGNCLVVSSADEGCGNPLACNFDPEVPAEEDNCEFLSCRGCSNPAACNYDPSAQIQTEVICEYLSCSGCTDPTATNYNPEAVIADDSGCVFSGLLAIAPVSTSYNNGLGPNQHYTNEVYALLPPSAIRLKRVLGVKGGEVTLKISPFGSLYNSASCGDWNPHDMTVSTMVDGVEYVNPDCFADSWFTIGGTYGDGPALLPLGFDPATLDGLDVFDSESLAAEGDTIGWEIAGEDGGVPTNHCEELLNRPGCANSVRIARLTLPLGQSFVMRAGLTYTVNDPEGRSLVGQDLTDDSSISSDSGGGGEADSDEAVITDGAANIINGCLDATACNYDASANADSGDCDYDSCAGCTYPDADNYDAENTVDDGSCTFSGTSACPFDSNGDGSVGAADLLDFLGAFDSPCE